ncbi:MAG: hypothetical protein RR224_04070 [Clostridia bacterium]
MTDNSSACFAFGSIQVIDVASKKETRKELIFLAGFVMPKPLLNMLHTGFFAFLTSSGSACTGGVALGFIADFFCLGIFFGFLSPMINTIFLRSGKRKTFIRQHVFASACLQS